MTAKRSHCLIPSRNGKWGKTIGDFGRMSLDQAPDELLAGIDGR